jgi:hypothetical protein
MRIERFADHFRQICIVDVGGKAPDSEGDFLKFHDAACSAQKELNAPLTPCGRDICGEVISLEILTAAHSQ